MSLHYLIRTSASRVAIALAVLLGFTCCRADADLWIDGGFEGNEVNSVGWTGTDSFHTATSATIGAAASGATFNTFIHDELVTESGTWVQDSAHSYSGDRMFWLNDYDDPDTICVGHQFNNLVAGQKLRLTWNFAAFNPVVSGGSSTNFVKPAVELSYRDSVTNNFEVIDQVIDFGSGGTSDPSIDDYDMFALQDWNNLSWDSATSIIDVPETNGQEITIWVSYLSDADPRNTLPNSNIGGLLIDNIALVAVPEPTMVTLTGLLMLGLGTCRRRK